MRHTRCTTHAATPCLTPCAIRHASCHAPRLPLLLSTCQFSTRKTKKAPSPMIQSRWRKASHPQTGRDMKSSTRSRACFLVGVRVGVRVRVRVRVLPQTLSAGGDSLSLAPAPLQSALAAEKVAGYRRRTTRAVTLAAPPVLGASSPAPSVGSVPRTASAPLGLAGASIGATDALLQANKTGRVIARPFPDLSRWPPSAISSDSWRKRGVYTVYTGKSTFFNHGITTRCWPLPPP